MFDKLALQYLTQDISFLTISVMCIIIGGSLAFALHKRKANLGRIPYFVYCGFLATFQAIPQIVWLDANAAIRGGYLWVYIFADLIVQIIFGYLLCIIAMARSRDAFSYPHMAVLAFLPPANLWLYFAGSKNNPQNSSKYTIRLLKGKTGMWAGIFLVIINFSLYRIIHIESLKIDGEPHIQEFAVRKVLKSDGLEETLRRVANEVPRKQIDSVTTLVMVESNESTIRYIYIVSGISKLNLRLLKNEAAKNHCSNRTLNLFLEKGVAIEHLYRQPNGNKLGFFSINDDSCDFLN